MLPCRARAKAHPGESSLSGAENTASALDLGSDACVTVVRDSMTSMVRNTSHRDCLGTLLAWPFCFATRETNEWENAQRQQIVHESYRMHRLMRIIAGGPYCEDICGCR